MTEVIVEKQSRLESSKRVLGRTARIAIALGFSFAGGALAMNTIGKTSEQVGPVPVSVGFAFDPSNDWLTPLDGGTKIGAEDAYAFYDTHPLGAEFQVIPKDVHLSELEKMVASGVGSKGMSVGAAGSIEDSALKDLDRIKDEKFAIGARSLGSFTIGAFIVGAGLAVYSSRKKNGGHGILEPLVASGVTSTILVGSTLVGVANMDEKALLEPHYHGIVAEAFERAKTVPDFTKLADSTVQNVAGVISLANLIEQQAQNQANIPNVAQRIMVGSDPHDTDDSGYVLSENKYDKLSAYISAGDLTNFGLAQENQYVFNRRVSKAGIDQFVVPGNHDTNAQVEFLRKIPNVSTVEKGEMTAWDIHGLRVLAIGDGNFTPTDGVVNGAMSEDEIGALREQIVAEVERASTDDTPYDWVVTHDPALLEGLQLGDVKGIITGHQHKYSFANESDEPWHLRAGSISGAGLRADQDANGTTTDQQYSILTVDKSCQLIYVDSITTNPFGTSESYSFERTYNDSYAPEAATLNDRCAS